MIILELIIERWFFSPENSKIIELHELHFIDNDCFLGELKGKRSCVASFFFLIED